MEYETKPIIDYDPSKSQRISVIKEVISEKDMHEEVKKSIYSVLKEYKENEITKDEAFEAISSLYNYSEETSTVNSRVKAYAENLSIVPFEYLDKEFTDESFDELLDSIPEDIKELDDLFENSPWDEEDEAELQDTLLSRL